MNLWDKSLLIRQLTVLVVALFFFSCEDETSLLGYRNPNPKFDVRFIEIPIGSSVLLVDSVITDNVGTQGINMVGEYDDAIFGKMRAETYLQMLPGNSSKIDETSVYDSVTFQMRLSFYSYGFTGEQDMSFDIHELVGGTPYLDSARTRYYYNSTIAYDPQPLGTATVHVNYDSLIKQYALSATPNLQDTLLMRGKLSDEFGRRLFNLAINDPGSAYSDQSEFVKRIKGLAITSTASSGIIGVNALTNFSRVIMHYHTITNGVVADTLQQSFTFGATTYDPNFTNYTVNRSATQFSSLFPYQDQALLSGLRGVQSASPLITKVDLSNFYAFTDTAGAIVVNSAEFVIDNIESPSDPTPLHTQLKLRVIHSSNQFQNVRVKSDSVEMAPYFAKGTGTITPGLYYYVRADYKNDPRTNQPAVAPLDYIADDHRFSGFMTLFFQDLVKYKSINNVVNATRINSLAIWPSSPGESSGVNRTKFNAENIKLRIFYTKPSAAVKLN
jgi:hypothetical protein